MKKMIIIIIILIIIFSGMLLNKNIAKKNNVTIDEINKIEEYINKMYCWREVTGEAMPKFEDINNAPDIWIWEVVKKNLDEYEITYEQIMEKAKELFGKNFAKEYPKEGTEYIQYDKETQKYYAIGMGLDEDEDLFLMNTIKKVQNGYEVEIIEYLEDYSNYNEVIENMNEEEVNEEEIDYDIHIKNTEGKIISTVRNTENESKKLEIVKENIDQFTKKIITLENDENGNIYVVKVE